MNLTEPQVRRFWREWSSACKTQAWPKPEIEPQRKALLARAGFTSLTAVDQGKGFTAVLKELAILQDNIRGMLRADANERRQILWQIEHCDQAYKLPKNYWLSIARDRWNTTNLTQLTDQDLVQLRNTLASRAVEQHTPAKKSRDQSKRRASTLDPRPSTLNRLHFGSKDLVPAHPNPDQQNTRSIEEPELEAAAVGSCDDSDPF